jgi:hypothetical protein
MWYRGEGITCVLAAIAFDTATTQCCRETALLHIHLHGSYGRLTQEGARMVAPRYIILLAFSSLGLTGCAASLQDLHYSVVNKSRAEYAWYSGTTFGDRWNSGGDYAHGYKSGYYDASTGKGCVLPAVPPHCYWSTKYQSCEGQKQIQDWYRGYQCGVTAAQGAGYPYFHAVPIGPQAPVVNKDGCGMCYAPTGCLCENESELPVQLPMQMAKLDTSLASQTSPAVHQEVVSQDSIDFGLIGPAGSALEVQPVALTSGMRSSGAGEPTFR